MSCQYFQSDVGGYFHATLSQSLPVSFWALGWTDPALAEQSFIEMQEPPHSSNGYSLLKQWLSLPECFSEDNQNYYWGPGINCIEQFSRKSPQTALGKNMEVCCWGHLKIFFQQRLQQPFFICLTVAMLAVVIDLMVQRLCSASTTFWFLQRFSSSWWNK